MGMVQQLVALIRSEHSTFHEHVLGALCRYRGDWAAENDSQDPGGSLTDLLRATGVLGTGVVELFGEGSFVSCYRPEV